METNFETLYNNIEEYRSFREDKNKELEYQIWTNWKVNNLINILEKGIVFNNVMEVGCAFGVVVNKFAKRCNIHKIIGLDIAIANTTHGERMFPNIKFITGTIDKENLLLESGINDNKFDLIILCDIIEHVPDELEFMKKIKKIAKYVVIDLPLEKSKANKNRNYGVNDISGHLRSYDLNDGLNLLKEAGFQIINYKTEIVYHDKDCFNWYINDRKSRLLKKSILKRLYWTFYYFIEDFILKNFDSYYIKMRGCNLFAFIKSNEE